MADISKIEVNGTIYPVKDSGASRTGHTHSYNDLSNKPSIPSAVTESTVSDWGFTKNKGTVTNVSVKINGAIAGSVSTSGIIDLGDVGGGIGWIVSGESGTAGKVNADTLNGQPASYYRNGSVTVTIPENKWSEVGDNSGIYIAAIQVPGMTSTWIPGIPIAVPGYYDASISEAEQDEAISNALSCITKITSTTGYLMFYCYNGKPDYTNVPNLTLRVPEVK